MSAYYNEGIQVIVGNGQNFPGTPRVSLIPFIQRAYDKGLLNFTTLPPGAIDFTEIQNIATNKLLGRSTAGSGVIEELTIGTGLSLSGGTLSNTATASPPAGSDGYIQYNNSGAFGASSNLFWDKTNNRLGIGTSSPTSTLTISGSGSTSATTSLLVRNSSADNTFKVQDNGTTTVTGNSDRNDIFVVGNPANSIGLGSNTANNPVLRLGLMNFSVHPSGNSWSFNNQSNSFTLYNNGSAGKGPFILCGNVDGTAGGDAFILQSLARQNGTKHNPTSGILNIVSIEPNLSTYTEFNPTSGNATYNILNVEQYINTTGSYSGIVRGIYYNPTVVSKIGATHNAIETTAGNIIFNNGNVGIGTSSPSAMLQVKGSGSTSATTSLLVQNSSGTELMRVKDNGLTTVNNPTSGASILKLNTAGSTYFDFSSNVAGYMSFSTNSRSDFRINNAYISSRTYGLNISMGSALEGSASAVVSVLSTTQGFLPPTMTTTQKNAIPSPVEGLIVYDLTLHKLCVYTGSAWETITSL